MNDTEKLMYIFKHSPRLGRFLIWLMTRKFENWDIRLGFIVIGILLISFGYFLIAPIAQQKTIMAKDLAEVWGPATVTALGTIFLGTALFPKLFGIKDEVKTR